MTKSKKGKSKSSSRSRSSSSGGPSGPAPSPEGARARSPSLDPIPGTSRGDDSRVPSPAGAEGFSLRSDDQPLQQRSPRAGAAYRQRYEKLRNFAYMIHQLIRSIRFDFWTRQCLIGFSPRINEDEEYQLKWESELEYLAALNGFESFISDPTFEDNLALLQSNDEILQDVLKDCSSLLKLFDNSIQDGKFQHSGDSMGAYGPSIPRFPKITHYASVDDLIIRNSILGMREAIDEFQHVLSSIFTSRRSHQIDRYRGIIARLIADANARLRYLQSTDELQEPPPPEVVFDQSAEEMRSILRLDRQSSPKQTSLGSVIRRFVSVDKASGKDAGMKAEETFETLEAFQYVRDSERKRALEEDERRRKLHRASQQGKKKGKKAPQTPFKERRVRHEDKQAVSKDTFVSQLTKGYPDRRTVILVSPPESAERLVEPAEDKDENKEDNDEDEDVLGHDSHNVFFSLRRCRQRDDESIDPFGPPKRHRRAV